MSDSPEPVIKRNTQIEVQLPSAPYSPSILNSRLLSASSAFTGKDSYSYGVILVGSSRIASVSCWNAFRSGVLNQLFQSSMLFQVLITRWIDGSSSERKVSPEI